MALERWDYCKEKKPRLWTSFLFPFVWLVFYLILYFYTFPSLRSSIYSDPVRSIPHGRSAPMAISPDKFQNLPPQKIFKEESLFKGSPIVRSVPAGYQGYVEVNGVRKEVYSKAVVSETYRYHSVSNVKFIPAKINGVEFDMMIDTGASQVSLNSDAVRKLGITHFTDKKIHSTAAGDVWAYYFPCSVTLGSFEVSNIQCSYNPENTGGNLLGGSFLKNFNYSFNESENTVTLSLR